MLKQILLLVVWALSACAPSPSDVYAQRRILFVGNSLTFYNDLPRTVQAIADAAGENLHVAMSAEPNLALIDHLNGQSDALSRLRASRWDFVVLQQGPSTTAVNRDSLILWTKQFKPHIDEARAQPALFMVWPGQNTLQLMNEVRISYQEAARAVDGLFLPAGEAWRMALEENPSLALYGADGFHPADLGSYLAALVIYARITGVDPRTLPATVFAGGRRVPAPPATVQALQRAAYDALGRYPD